MPLNVHLQFTSMFRQGIILKKYFTLLEKHYPTLHMDMHNNIYRLICKSVLPHDDNIFEKKTKFIKKINLFFAIFMINIINIKQCILTFCFFYFAVTL